MREHTQLFKALADETRLRLAKLLASADTPLCVCELTDATGLPQYQVSKALSVLRQAGLVTDSRIGTWVHYQVVAQPTAAVAALCHLVQGHVDGPTCRRDAQRLRARLTLREAGRCVVGLDPQVYHALSTLEQVDENRPEGDVKEVQK